MPGGAAISLLDRLQSALAGLGSRITGRSAPAEAAITQASACGGSRGAGLALGLKLAATCLGTLGGAAVGLATGVIPGATVAPGDETPPAAIERRASAAERSSLLAAKRGAGASAAQATSARVAGPRAPGEAGHQRGRPSAAQPARARDTAATARGRRRRPAGGPRHLGRRPRRGGLGAETSRIRGGPQAPAQRRAGGGGRRPRSGDPTEPLRAERGRGRRGGRRLAPPEKANRPTRGAVGGEERVLLLPARYVCRQIPPGRPPLRGGPG